MDFSKCFFGKVFRRVFYRFLEVLGLPFKGFWTTFVVFSGKREIVKTSTACAGELDFQGLAGSGSICFRCFLGFRFGMALGMDFE